MESVRLLVCGGRDFTDYTTVQNYLDAIHAQLNISVLIHGGARGADSMGGFWARERNVPVEVYPALWKEHGRRAGPIRNQQMLDEGKPDLVVAFPGGTGTQDMIDRSRKAGVLVEVVAKIQQK